MSIKFEIHYNENPLGVFYTGQVVKGQAVINLYEPVSVKGVRIRARGYARVRWDEGDTSSSDIHSDEEKYFEETTECIDIKGSETKLEIGAHTFNFEYMIPLQCPSSFEGTFGRIRYDTKITLVRPLLFNKSHSAGFNVVTVYDLNRFSHLMIPTGTEVLKHFCCGLCKSKPLILSSCVQKAGFVPGEFANVNVKLNNRSSSRVNQIRISLILIAVYSVSGRVSKNTEKITISKKKFEVVSQRSMEITEKIQIPSTVPNSDGLCKIINITYEFEVTAKVEGAHRNPALSIPITIGNVPFVASAESANLSEDSLVANLISSVPKSSGPLMVLENENAPLSYQEADFMRSLESTLVNVDKDSSSEKFVPRYPFYNNLQPISIAPRSGSIMDTLV